MATAATDLAAFIQQTPLVDSHEHLKSESTWVDHGHDALGCIFSHYVQHDLLTAGATPEAMRLITDSSIDLDQRLAGLVEPWKHVRHTGYGRAAQYVAREIFGVEELTADALAAAEPILKQIRQPGQRLKLLRDKANLDHCQVDLFGEMDFRDEPHPEFFLYDLSMLSAVACMPQLPHVLGRFIDSDLRDLATLGDAIEAAFASEAAGSIAVKTQHAYQRTLAWEPRTDADAQEAFARYLKDPENAQTADRLCVGDWCLQRVAELCAEHDLPMKIHTGHMAGNGFMKPDRLRTAHLGQLFGQHPQTRFVLMHTAWPYQDELVAMAKHYPNVWVDFCWAWSMTPYGCARMVGELIHAVPDNKVFVFGGDTFWPPLAVAYAHQARQWFTYALQHQIDQGLLTEPEAIEIARKWMGDNQRACFRVEPTRQAAAQAAKNRGGGIK